MHGHEYTAQFEAPGGEPVLDPYPDPLTGGEPITVGLGHTGPDVKLGERWTRDRCFAAYYNDYAIASAVAPHVIYVSAFSQLNEQRKAALIDMCFNPGPTKLVLFHKTLDAIRKADWQTAHDELLDSLYARQLKTRAKSNALILLTGEWPNEASS